MSSSFQIESRPKWYALPQALSSLVWFVLTLLMSFVLFRRISMLAGLPISFHLGSIFTYLGFLVSCVFVLRCSSAFKRSEYGPLRVISVSGFTKTLAILACLGAAASVVTTFFAWRDASTLGEDKGGMLGMLIAIGLGSVWIFFLTVKVVFGKKEPSYSVT